MEKMSISERIKLKDEKTRQQTIEASINAAIHAVSHEEYQNADIFYKHWNSSENKKHLLSFMLRRTAHFAHLSYLAESSKKSAKDAAWNITGALLGGAEGAGSMAQMGVQNADLQYRMVKTATDTLHLLANEMLTIDAPIDDQQAELVIQKVAVVFMKGVGTEMVNIQSVIHAANDCIANIYDFDKFSELCGLERKRRAAFIKEWKKQVNQLGHANTNATEMVKQYHKAFQEQSCKAFQK